MDSHNTSKRSRYVDTDSDSPTPNPDSQIPTTQIPLNMNNWAGFTPSQLQNTGWGSQFSQPPFGTNQVNQPSNIFSHYQPGTIYEDQQFRPQGPTQVPLMPFQQPFMYRPHSQHGSTGDGSSTDTIPQEPSQSQPNIETSDDVLWMNDEQMAKICSKGGASEAWPHFIKSVDKKLAKCRYCKTTLSAMAKNGTGHLLRHTKKCSARPAEGQRPINQFMSRPVDQSYTYNYDECADELSRMIIQTEKPFLHVEQPAFNRYMLKNQPQHKETSRKTVRNKGMVQYLEAKQSLIALFEKTKCKFSITADGWDSGTDYSYLCITAHWLDDDWVLQKRIIDFARLEFPHNAANMHSIIMNGINEYGLASKIITVTFDNASSMTSVANMLKTSLQEVLLDGKLLHVRCACHVLNLCIKDGLSCLSQYHDKFKDIVMHLHTTNWRRQQWRDFCRANNVKYVKFPAEDKIRWNSMYKMLKALRKYKEPLTVFWNRCCPTQKLYEVDWQIMGLYVDLLKAFKNATSSFSHVYKPTSPYFIGNVIPIAHVFSNSRSNPAFVSFLPKMEEKWLKYWADIPYIFVFTVILDPRWKFDGAISLISIYKSLMSLPFNEEVYKEDVRSAFFTVYSHYESVYGNYGRISSSSGAGSSSGGTTSSITSTTFRGSNFYSLQGLIGQLQPNRQQTTPTSNLAEYQMYISYDYMRGVSDDEINTLDLLKFWRQQTRSLPVMSAMARDFLCVQASSVASECAFSGAKRVLDDKRTSLRSDTLRMLVCYKDWMDAKDKEQNKVEFEYEDESDEQSSTESNPRNSPNNNPL